MQLSERLYQVATSMNSHGVVADIGCDHGFTSIYLVEQGLAESAIAMDINRGPLERAKQHIKEYHLEEKIQVRLSDGLEKLEKGEADTILISGMGGCLMNRILSAKPEVMKSVKELVLSPQSDIDQVRRFLHQSCFRIEEEKILIDQGKYYVVIRAVPGEESAYNEEEYIYGKYLIEKKHPVLIEFLHKEKKRVEKILAGLSGTHLSEIAQKKREELEKEKVRIEDVLSKMD